MVEGGEEGSEETTTHPLDLLYAGTTNETKQRNKRDQTKSPDQSVILLSHDKKGTMERPKAQSCAAITVRKISHA